MGSDHNPRTSTYVHTYNPIPHAQDQSDSTTSVISSRKHAFTPPGHHPALLGRRDHRTNLFSKGPGHSIPALEESCQPATKDHKGKDK